MITNSEDRVDERGGWLKHRPKVENGLATVTYLKSMLNSKYYRMTVEMMGDGPTIPAINGERDG